MTDLTWQNILGHSGSLSPEDENGYAWYELELYTVPLANRTIVKIEMVFSHYGDTASKTRWSAILEHFTSDGTIKFFRDIVTIVDSIIKWANDDYITEKTRESLNEYLRFLESPDLKEIHFSWD